MAAQKQCRTYDKIFRSFVENNREVICSLKEHFCLLVLIPVGDVRVFEIPILAKYHWRESSRIAKKVHPTTNPRSACGSSCKKWNCD